MTEENRSVEENILDATCGGRSIWHESNKDREDTLYIDIREVDDPDELQNRVQSERNRTYSVEPDEIQDYRDLPYQDQEFDLVVWDPPHKILDNGMESLNGIIEKKYGALHAETWQGDLKKGFRELWRVLRPRGTLYLKFQMMRRTSRKFSICSRSIHASERLLIRRGRTREYFYSISRELVIMNDNGCRECGGQLVANGSEMICMDCGRTQDSETEIGHG